MDRARSAFHNENLEQSRIANPIINPDLKMINGPVNVVRLEGIVNGVTKVIYLFMDIHMDVQDQTQCRNIFSQDVQKFFVDSFFELGDEQPMYDFFVELYPTELHPRKSGSAPIREPKERYIEEVVKIFQKIFNYDPRRNRVAVNEMFDHVRLHYLDIRDYYKGSTVGLSSDTVAIASRFMKEDYISVRSLLRIIDILSELRDYVKMVIDILVHPPPLSKSGTPRIINIQGNRRQDRDAMEYLANKIHYNYSHPNVKKEVNKLLETTVKNFQCLIRDYDSMVKRFYDYIEILNKSKGKLTPTTYSSYLYNYGIDPYLEREMIIDIFNSLDKAHNEGFVEYFARFTDVYFLRRFLDKDYVTNAIVYCGSLHSNTYIHFLVNRFDFRVTHASYSSINNMNALTRKIKEIGLMQTQELFLPPVLHQCSDLTSFPDNFS